MSSYMTMTTIATSIKDIWKLRTEPALDDSIANIAKKLNTKVRKKQLKDPESIITNDYELYDMLWAVIAYFHIQPETRDGKVTEQWKSGDITFKQLVLHVLGQLIDKRKAKHKYGCTFENIIATSWVFIESGVEAASHGRFGSDIGELEPELSICTGYDSFTMIFDFCPVCGIKLDTLGDVDAA